MKRTLTTLVLGCLILCCFNVKAQTPDTSTVKKLLHYIMQPLDKSQVPSGFLEEYGCPILPMATFNGILTDSNRVDLNSPAVGVITAPQLRLKFNVLGVNTKHKNHL